MEISRVGAVWLVLLGALIWAILALIAVAPREGEMVERDAGARSSIMATHCGPEGGWPCEPSR